MKIVIPEPGRTFEIPQAELTYGEQNRIAAGLAEQGIHVTPVIDIFHVLHLWATSPCTTEQEVVALRAFAQCTDCRLAWHGAVA